MTHKAAGRPNGRGASRPGHFSLGLLGRLLPPPGPTRPLIAGVFAGAVSQGVFISCGVVFAVRSVGLRADQVGLGMSLSAGLAVLLPVPIGWFVDRSGARRSSVIFATATALSLAGYVFIWSFPTFFLVQLLGSGSILGAGVAQSALVANLLDSEDRTRFKAYQRSVRNAGMSLGALLAAVPLQIDDRTAYQLALLSGAACTAGSAWLIARVPVDGRPRTLSPKGWAMPFRDWRFTIVALLCGVTSIRFAVLTVALPLWITERTAAPRYLVSLTLLVNTALVILFQVRAARSAATTEGATRLNTRGSAALGCSCLLFGAASAGGGEMATAVLLIGVLVFTFGEMWTSAAAWTFSYDLTRSDRHGQYQATFALGTSVGSFLGPYLAGLMTVGAAFGWTGGAMVFLVTGAVTAALVSRTESHIQEREEEKVLDEKGSSC